MPAIDKVYAQIVDFAKDCGATEVVLFGSRARGDNLPKSDIDIAVRGCRDITRLYFTLQEDVDSLLEIDLVDLDSCHSPELLNDIERDGIVLYEKV